MIFSFALDPVLAEGFDGIVEAVKFCNGIGVFVCDVVVEVGLLDGKNGKFMPELGSIGNRVVIAILPKSLGVGVVGMLAVIGLVKPVENFEMKVAGFF